MKVLEIELKNPITHTEVEILIKKLISEENPGLLLIDYGDHEFESLMSMKYCKEQLLEHQAELIKFQKIAVVHNTKRGNTSTDENILRYFSSTAEAKEWFSV